MRKNHVFWLTLSGVLAILPFPLSEISWAQQIKPQSQSTLEREPLIPSLRGPDLFRAYCAPCHGIDGTGNGPVTPALKTKPPDLTTIARRNSGRFPTARIRAIILGENAIIAHGTREMPIWGPIFHQIENDRDFGNVRIESVVRYLESIQKQ
jgi:mono/diheme cytochrome c family protein